MISGINLTDTVSYQLKDDKTNPTTWKLGVIPNYLFAKISMNGNADIETVYKILQIGIKGWENFDVPFEVKRETFYSREIDAVPISILERIPMKYLTELSTKILEISQLTDTERKN